MRLLDRRAVGLTLLTSTGDGSQADSTCERLRRKRLDYDWRLDKC